MDEWAKRKGRTYGTIVVDLERRTVVDVLDTYDVEAVGALVRGPSRDPHDLSRPQRPLRQGRPHGRAGRHCRSPIAFISCRICARPSNGNCPRTTG